MAISALYPCKNFTQLIFYIWYMHIQLEFMLDMSYERHKILAMLKPLKEANACSSKRMARDCELRRMLREIMENPKK